MVLNRCNFAVLNDLRQTRQRQTPVRQGAATAEVLGFSELAK